MEINGFISWDQEPNTICGNCHVLIRTFHINTNNPSKNRLVRVYLPSTYDFSNSKKRFPVLYMMDGKNLFDDYTSFVGEWGIDETIENKIKENLTQGIIVVGIDAPKVGYDRTLEMFSKDYIPTKRSKIHHPGYAELLGKFIFNELKPVIDGTFFTKKDKKHTGVGGSSMGGLMSFFLATTYPKKVGYCLSYSPAFFLLDKSYFDSYIKNINYKDVGMIYFYVGGEGFEKLFVDCTKKTYEYLRSINKEDVKLVIDSSQEHNEKAWGLYFPDSLDYFNYLN